MIEGWENRYGIAILNNFGSNEGMCLASGPDDVPNASERGELFRDSVLRASLGQTGWHRWSKPS